MSAEKISEKKYSFFKTILRIIPIQYKSTPWHNTCNILMGIFNALSLTTVTITTQKLFDTVAEAATGRVSFRDCITPLLLMAGATFGQQIIDGVHNFHGGVMFMKSRGNIKFLLFRKIQRIDPACFEDTDFLDDMNKAREGVLIIPIFCMIIFVLVSYYAVFFASIGAYLFFLKPMLLVVLAISYIPALLSQIVRGKVFTKLEQESAPLRREYDYYQRTLCDREYFKETRILGAFHFFHRLFVETTLLFSSKKWRAECKTALLQLLMNITSFVGMAISSYMLFTATMSGEITVGAFAAVFAALGSIFAVMQEIISGHIGNMNRDIGKVANFIRMLDMPERTGEDGTSDFSKGIKADNVTFIYPGRNNPAVKNVSLTIADGEIIAIVGENGAGKSTLVRLLTGVYRPSEGKVTIGGLDTAKITPESIYKGISGVFQKYQRYKMTLGENVTISDVERASDMVHMETALREAGSELEDAALDTMLSPEFDGIDLSGGQWQRLAIARGLYRANGFIVLDEPTAAIDPIEETRVYSQFQQLTKDKCAIVVTHRLGSAKLAHRIIVMDAGEIVDIGTHEELLSRPGKYTDMWTAQAQWYERQPTCTQSRQQVSVGRQSI